uniref:C2H2-type domain-containing protein n=1 Tax=Nothobranchius korthausae TaxID=1143690 RepID=A0A1A8GSR7_9TELE
MSLSQKLHSFVSQRLNVAIEEIMAAFEKTIVKYEEEAALNREVISRQHALLCSLNGSTGDVFTQQTPFGKELMSDTHQNLIQGVVLEPSVTEEKLQDEQLQDLHDVEIIEFTYNSKHATTPRDDFQLLEEQEPDPSQDVAQVLSSDTEDSEDYSKDYAEVRTPRENSEWFCRPKEGFSCQACSRTFKHRRVLFRHVTAHIRDAEQVCGLCGERFGADGGLKLHLQTHIRKRKKLDPALCGERYGANGGLKPPLQTHTRKKKKKQDPALCGEQFGADGGSKPRLQTRKRKTKKQGLAKTQSRKKGVQSPSEHNKNKKTEKADDSSKPLVKRPRGRPRKNKQDQDNSGGTKKTKKD